VVDVFDRAGLLAVLAEERPDVVISQLTDLSARDPAANARLRVEGMRNLVDASLEAGTRRMIAQSIAWAYAPGSEPATEEDPLDLGASMPRRTTIEGVAALERAVGEMSEGIVLRYGLLYGSGTFYVPDGPVATAVREERMPANDAVSSFLHVEDAARSALLALEWPAGVVNIVDDEPAPASEWLPVYAAAVGAPTPGNVPGGSRTERGASNARARKHFGWEPHYRSWRVGFRVALG
jgi:nucleoside-diphosphate-sugar epimerase